MAARGSRPAVPAQITLAPIVLIKGPEGLLVDRALDQLRALAHEADPNLERTDINAATYQAGQLDVIASPSLFGESRMVIIRDLETMSDALANDLIAYAGAPAPDVWMFLAHPGGNARGKKVIDTITKAKWPVIPAEPLKNDRDKLALIASGVRWVTTRARWPVPWPSCSPTSVDASPWRTCAATRPGASRPRATTSRTLPSLATRRKL